MAQTKGTAEQLAAMGYTLKYDAGKGGNYIDFGNGYTTNDLDYVLASSNTVKQGFDSLGRPADPQAIIQGAGDLMRRGLRGDAALKHVTTVVKASPEYKQVQLTQLRQKEQEAIASGSAEATKRFKQLADKAEADINASTSAISTASGLDQNLTQAQIDALPAEQKAAYLYFKSTVDPEATRQGAALDKDRVEAQERIREQLASQGLLASGGLAERTEKLESDVATKKADIRSALMSGAKSDLLGRRTSAITNQEKLDLQIAADEISKRTGIDIETAKLMAQDAIESGAKGGEDLAKQDYLNAQPGKDSTVDFIKDLLTTALTSVVTGGAGAIGAQLGKGLIGAKAPGSPGEQPQQPVGSRASAQTPAFQPTPFSNNDIPLTPFLNFNQGSPLIGGSNKELDENPLWRDQ